MIHLEYEYELAKFLMMYKDTNTHKKSVENSFPLHQAYALSFITINL